MSLTGTRIPKVCDSTSTYFSLINECISNDYASLPAFLEAFEAGHTCHGGNITTVDELEGLRYCDTIAGDLAILVADANADFTSLYDIEIVEGIENSF